MNSVMIRNALAILLLGTAACVAETGSPDDGQEPEEVTSQTIMVGRWSNDGAKSAARPKQPAAAPEMGTSATNLGGPSEGPQPDPWHRAGPQPDPWNPDDPPPNSTGGTPGGGTPGGNPGGSSSGGGNRD